MAVVVVKMQNSQCMSACMHFLQSSSHFKSSPSIDALSFSFFDFFFPEDFFKPEDLLKLLAEDFFRRPLTEDDFLMPEEDDALRNILPAAVLLVALGTSLGLPHRALESSLASPIINGLIILGDSRRTGILNSIVSLAATRRMGLEDDDDEADGEDVGLFAARDLPSPWSHSEPHRFRPTDDLDLRALTRLIAFLSHSNLALSSTMYILDLSKFLSASKFDMKDDMLDSMYWLSVLLLVTTLLLSKPLFCDFKHVAGEFIDAELWLMIICNETECKTTSLK